MSSFSSAINSLAKVLDKQVLPDEIHLDIEDEQSIIPDLVEEDFEKLPDDLGSHHHHHHQESNSANDKDPNLHTRLPNIFDVAKGVCDKTADEYRM